MKFSAQEEYGLRCLLSLAREGDDGFLTIPEISKREGLTPSHVAKLLSILRRAGFVNSTRGQLGGYSLGRRAKDMVVRDVLEALGGRLYDEGFCERHSGILTSCVHDTDCLIRPLWSNVQHAVDSVLSNVTVADLVAGELADRNVTFGTRPERANGKPHDPVEA